MRVVSLKTVLYAVFFTWTAAVLGVCVMEPVSLTVFVGDSTVQGIIEKGLGKVNITGDSDGNLTAGSGRITGLDPTKYYMIEEWGENASSTSPPMSVQFVTSNGTRSPNLTQIGRVPGTAITGLTNSNNYRVKYAKALTGSVTWYALATTPGTSDTGTTVTIDASGKATVSPTASPPPSSEYYLKLPTPIFSSNGTLSYNIAGLPIPSGQGQTVTLDTNNIIKLRGEKTETDYIFVLMSGSNLAFEIQDNIRVLKVAVSSPPEVRLTLTPKFTPDGSPVVTPPNNTSLTYSQDDNSDLQLGINNASQFSDYSDTDMDDESKGIRWYINGKLAGKGQTFTLKKSDNANKIIGTYLITVEACKSISGESIPYSATITVTVTQGTS